ncbi:MAG: 4Fe-4S binding protein [Kiritimatiellae bacterium]|nr:4Fe-4S binding protein [Kiritimatiellia bacterium]
MKMTYVALKSLFSSPATANYPAEPKTYYPGTRGHIVLEVSTCTLCKICEIRCPTGAIQVDREGKAWSIERMKCIQCGFCVDSCPRKCLSNDPQYTSPASEKITDRLDVPYEPPKRKPKPETPPAQ